MFKSIFSILVLLQIALTQTAVSQTFGKSLQSARLEKVGTNLILKVKPNSGHHYNLDAPTKILKDGKDIKPASLLPSILEVTVSTEGKCEYQIQTYVCDDKKTFCAPQNMNMSCDDLKKLSTKPEFSGKGSISVTAADINGPAISSVEKDTQAKKKDLFIVNDPKMALELAKKTNRPLFIDFFGTWCPPCNILDETVFNSPLFARHAKNMVLLKLDADDKVSWELKSKFAVTGYPTVILATAHGDEITRFLGSLPERQIVKLMKYATENKNTSLAQKADLYKTKATPKLALEIIESIVPTENYEAAMPYVPLALQNSQLTISQKEILLMIPIFTEAKAKKGEFSTAMLPLLKGVFETYPISDIYYQKLELLGSIVESLKDEDLKKWVYETNLKQVETSLAKKHLDLDSVTRVDLHFLRANSFEKLGQSENEKKVHAQIADEYSKLISEYKQNPKTNRGYNLGRVYSIYKSGDIKGARVEYEKLIDAYPKEFTFHYNYASVLKDLKEWDEALRYAKNALTYSYGDNQLRAIYLVAEIEANKGLKKESLDRLTQALQTTELPKDETVRTHRYLKRLADLKSKIESNKL